MHCNKDKILEIVRQIPEQKVMYFGQIGFLTAIHPRVVGWIMSGLSITECENLPWYRVVAKNGFVSSLKLGFKGINQKMILQEQGYTLIGNFVDMRKHCITDQELKNFITTKTFN